MQDDKAKKEEEARAAARLDLLESTYGVKFDLPIRSVDEFSERLRKLSSFSRDFFTYNHVHPNIPSDAPSVDEPAPLTDYSQQDGAFRGLAFWPEFEKTSAKTRQMLLERSILETENAQDSAFSIGPLKRWDAFCWSKDDPLVMKELDALIKKAEDKANKDGMPSRMPYAHRAGERPPGIFISPPPASSESMGTQSTNTSNFTNLPATTTFSRNTSSQTEFKHHATLLTGMSASSGHRQWANSEGREVRGPNLFQQAGRQLVDTPGQIPDDLQGLTDLGAQATAASHQHATHINAAHEKLYRGKSLVSKRIVEEAYQRAGKPVPNGPLPHSEAKMSSPTVDAAVVSGRASSRQSGFLRTSTHVTHQFSKQIPSSFNCRGEFSTHDRSGMLDDEWSLAAQRARHVQAARGHRTRPRSGTRRRTRRPSSASSTGSARDSANNTEGNAGSDNPARFSSEQSLPVASYLPRASAACGSIPVKHVPAAVFGDRPRPKPSVSTLLGSSSAHDSYDTASIEAVAAAAASSNQGRSTLGLKTERTGIVFSGVSRWGPAGDKARARSGYIPPGEMSARHKIRFTIDRCEKAVCGALGIPFGTRELLMPKGVDKRCLKRAARAAKVGTPLAMARALADFRPCNPTHAPQDLRPTYHMGKEGTQDLERGVYMLHRAIPRLNMFTPNAPLGHPLLKPGFSASIGKGHAKLLYQDPEVIKVRSWAADLRYWLRTEAYPQGGAHKGSRGRSEARHSRNATPRLASKKKHQRPRMQESMSIGYERVQHWQNQLSNTVSSVFHRRSRQNRAGKGGKKALSGPSERKQVQMANVETARRVWLAHQEFVRILERGQSSSAAKGTEGDGEMVFVKLLRESDGESQSQTTTARALDGGVFGDKPINAVHSIAQDVDFLNVLLYLHENRIWIPPFRNVDVAFPPDTQPSQSSKAAPSNTSGATDSENTPEKTEESKQEETDAKTDAVVIRKRNKSDIPLCVQRWWDLTFSQYGETKFSAKKARRRLRKPGEKRVDNAGTGTITASSAAIRDCKRMFGDSPLAAINEDELERYIRSFPLLPEHQGVRKPRITACPPRYEDPSVPQKPPSPPRPPPPSTIGSRGNTSRVCDRNDPIYSWNDQVRFVDFYDMFEKGGRVKSLHKESTMRARYKAKINRKELMAYSKKIVKIRTTQQAKRNKKEQKELQRKLALVRSYNAAHPDAADSDANSLAVAEEQVAAAVSYPALANLHVLSSVLRPVTTEEQPKTAADPADGGQSGSPTEDLVETIDADGRPIEPQDARLDVLDKPTPEDESPSAAGGVHADAKDEETEGVVGENGGVDVQEAQTAIAEDDGAGKDEVIESSTSETATVPENTDEKQGKSAKPSAGDAKTKKLASKPSEDGKFVIILPETTVADTPPASTGRKTRRPAYPYRNRYTKQGSQSARAGGTRRSRRTPITPQSQRASPQQSHRRRDRVSPQLSDVKRVTTVAPWLKHCTPAGKARHRAMLAKRARMKRAVVKVRRKQALEKQKIRRHIISNRHAIAVAEKEQNEYQAWKVQVRRRWLVVFKWAAWMQQLHNKWSGRPATTDFMVLPQRVQRAVRRCYFRWKLFVRQRRKTHAAVKIQRCARRFIANRYISTRKRSARLIIRFLTYARDKDSFVKTMQEYRHKVVRIQRWWRSRRRISRARRVFVHRILHFTVYFHLLRMRLVQEVVYKRLKGAEKRAAEAKMERHGVPKVYVSTFPPADTARSKSKSALRHASSGSQSEGLSSARRRSTPRKAAGTPTQSRANRMSTTLISSHGQPPASPVGGSTAKKSVSEDEEKTRRSAVWYRYTSWGQELPSVDVSDDAMDSKHYENYIAETQAVNEALVHYMHRLGHIAQELYRLWSHLYTKGLLESDGYAPTIDTFKMITGKHSASSSPLSLSILYALYRTFTKAWLRSLYRRRARRNYKQHTQPANAKNRTGADSEQKEGIQSKQDDKEAQGDIEDSQDQSASEPELSAPVREIRGFESQAQAWFTKFQDEDSTSQDNDEKTADGQQQEPLAVQAGSSEGSEVSADSGTDGDSKQLSSSSTEHELVDDSTQKEYHAAAPLLRLAASPVHSDQLGPLSPAFDIATLSALKTRLEARSETNSEADNVTAIPGRSRVSTRLSTLADDSRCFTQVGYWTVRLGRAPFLCKVYRQSGEQGPPATPRRSLSSLPQTEVEYSRNPPRPTCWFHMFSVHSISAFLRQYLAKPASKTNVIRRNSVEGKLVGRKNSVEEKLLSR